jgi:hypothetical protein
MYFPQFVMKSEWFLILFVFEVVVIVYLGNSHTSPIFSEMAVINFKIFS